MKLIQGTTYAFRAVKLFKMGSWSRDSELSGEEMKRAEL